VNEKLTLWADKLIIIANDIGKLQDFIAQMDSYENIMSLTHSERNALAKLRAYKLGALDVATHSILSIARSMRGLPLNPHPQPNRNEPEDLPF